MHFFFRLFQDKPQPDPGTQVVPDAYWSLQAEKLMVALGSDASGLSAREANARLKHYGPNALEAKKQATALGLLGNQFKNPLVLILMVAAAISMVAAEWVDAGVVLVIVFGSTLLGFAEEYIAGNAIEKLRSKITIHSSVLRDGQPQTRPLHRVVPGDVVLLSAGSLMPADGVVLASKDFFINRTLT